MEKESEEFKARNIRLYERVDKLEEGSSEEELKPKRLPNMGNTCFLNSVLQFLFSVSLLRQPLIQECKRLRSKYTPEQLKFNLVYLVGQVFNYLRPESSLAQNDVQTILLRLMDTLERQLNINYLKYEQGDSFEVLLAFLDIIDSSLPEKQGIKGLFKVETVVRCRCKRCPIKKQDWFISNSRTICDRCESQLITKIIRQSRYLIVPVLKTGFQAISYEENGMRLISTIQYWGNGSSGHYICCRILSGIKTFMHDSYPYTELPIIEKTKDQNMGQTFQHSQQLRYTKLGGESISLVPQKENKPSKESEQKKGGSETGNEQKKQSWLWWISIFAIGYCVGFATNSLVVRA